MPGAAQITSLEAIELFRADLIVFLDQVRPLLEETSGAVTRMKFWLQNEQRDFWENQLSRRRRRLEQAQAELFHASFSSFQTSQTGQQLAVRQAQHAVQEAEFKLAQLKKWARDLENFTDPLLKPVGQLQGFLTTDMGKAVAVLAQILQTLTAYTEGVPPTTTLPPAAPNNPIP